MPVRAALLAAALLAILVASPRAAAAEPVPLTAVRGGDAPALETVDGREVLLRGVNVNQLNDYYAPRPELPTVFPLTERDFEQIAALGFNHVRLLMAWSRLEPRRGVLDTRYLGEIRRAVGRARRHGLYVVLDMHQDAWGKHIATPPGETCPPGFTPAVGWDGAPLWATLTDGLSTCRGQQRELSPAVAQAFSSFWADRDGIQTAFIATWARVVRAFAAEPAIAGWDPFNEPHPGWTPGATGPTLLGAFYARWIEAARAAERSVPGGFHHVVFFEPHVTWSGLGADTVPPPTFSDDRRIVFSPHLYAESIGLDGGAVMSVENGFRAAETAADGYGTTVYAGEYGWFGDPQADARKLARYAREEDARRWSGAWWSWKQACGDPHLFGHPGAPGGEMSPSLNRYRCPGGTLLGRPAAFTRILGRAYPRAAPGRITQLRSDPDTGAFEMAGRDPDRRGSCRLELWFPGELRPALETAGMARVEVRRRPGGWLATGCASGRYAVRRVGSEMVGPAVPVRTADGCRPRRRLRIALRVRRPARVRVVRVRVDRGPARRLRGPRRAVRVRLRGLAPGRHVVRVVVRMRGGRRLVRRRTFRTCAPPRPGREAGGRRPRAAGRG